MTGRATAVPKGGKVAKPANAKPIRSARQTSPSAPTAEVAPKHAVCACGGQCPRCQSSSNSPDSQKQPIPPRPLHSDAAEREAARLAPQLLRARNAAGAEPRAEEKDPSAEHKPAQSDGNVVSFPGSKPTPATAPISSQPGALGTVQHNKHHARPGSIRAPPAKQAAMKSKRKLRVSNTPDRRLGHGRALTHAQGLGFGDALDFDLGPVRVHSGPYAAALAEDRQAAAFAFGTHIVLGEAAQRAGPDRQLAILAHELIHVVQQSAPVLPALRPATNWQHPPARGPPDAAGDVARISPLQRSPLKAQNFGLPDWVGNAASAVGSGISSVGSAAYDGASFVGGAVYDVGAGAVDLVVEIGGTILRGAEAIIDYVAPDLLDFLDGDFLETLGDWFCDGLDDLVSLLLDPLLNVDIMSALETTFTGMANMARQGYSQLGNAASAAIGFILAPFLKVIEFFGDDIISAVQALSGGVIGLFAGLWNNIAKPVLNFLGEIGGTVLGWFMDLAGWVWGLIKKVKNFAGSAFDWLMDKLGVNWSGESGVSDWVTDKAQGLWDSFLELIEPIKVPLKVVAGILAILSPLGPLVIMTQILPPLWDKLKWLVANWRDTEIVVRSRKFLKDVILPGIIDVVDDIKSAIMGAASWLAGGVAIVARGMSALLSVFSSSSCLKSVNRVLDHVAGQFDRLQVWAENGFGGLSGAIGSVFDTLKAIFQPILDFLIRLFVVIAVPPMIPVALTAVIWLLLPERFKPPVINFVLGLLIAAMPLLAVALSIMGPAGVIIQSAILGFLRHLRGGNGVTDKTRIKAADKVAAIMAGGGPQFVLGYAAGLVHGLIDGILDPFKLLFMLFELVMSGIKVIGRLLAPCLQQVAPGVVTDGLARYNAALALPPAAATPAPATATTPAAQPEVAQQLARGPPAASNVTTQTPLSQPSAVPVSAQPQPPACIFASEDSKAVAGNQPVETVSQTALEEQMRAEVLSKGSTVSGLGDLLGGAWGALMDGAGQVGAYLAEQLLSLLTLSDFDLGYKLGWLSGVILFEVLLAYFTAGGYTVIKEGASIGTRLLAYFLRFLDLGGEILGVMGRMLAPLKRPILGGLKATRGFLSRFAFIDDILGKIEGYARSLFRFGDEATTAGAQATPPPSVNPVRAVEAPPTPVAARAVEAPPTPGPARVVEAPPTSGPARAVEAPPAPRSPDGEAGGFTVQADADGVTRTPLGPDPQVVHVRARRQGTPDGGPPQRQTPERAPELAPDLDAPASRGFSRDEILESHNAATLGNGRPPARGASGTQRVPDAPGPAERHTNSVMNLENNQVFGGANEHFLTRHLDAGQGAMGRRFDTVATQVRVRPIINPSATGEARFASYTVIPDNLVIDRATGRYHFLDAKTTPRAPLSRNQRPGYPLIAANGGRIESRGLPGGLEHGTVLPATPVSRAIPTSNLAKGELPIGNTPLYELRPIVPAGGTAPLRDIPVTSPRYPAAVPGQAAPTAEVAGARLGREISETPPALIRGQDPVHLGNGSYRGADERGFATLRDPVAKTLQLPEVLVAAQVVIREADFFNLPLPVLLGQLMLLKRRYRWIDTFRADPIGFLRYDIVMIASRFSIGRVDLGDGPPANAPTCVL